jgi:hypothetical protein
MPFDRVRQPIHRPKAMLDSDDHQILHILAFDPLSQQPQKARLPWYRPRHKAAQELQALCGRLVMDTR